MNPKFLTVTPELVNWWVATKMKLENDEFMLKKTVQQDEDPSGNKLKPSFSINVATVTYF